MAKTTKKTTNQMTNMTMAAYRESRDRIKDILKTTRTLTLELASELKAVEEGGLFQHAPGKPKSMVAWVETELGISPTEYLNLRAFYNEIYLKRICSEAQAQKMSKTLLNKIGRAVHAKSVTIDDLDVAFKQKNLKAVADLVKGPTRTTGLIRVVLSQSPADHKIWLKAISNYGDAKSSVSEKAIEMARDVISKQKKRAR